MAREVPRSIAKWEKMKKKQRYVSQGVKARIMFIATASCGSATIAERQFAGRKEPIMTRISAMIAG